MQPIIRIIPYNYKILFNVLTKYMVVWNRIFDFIAAKTVMLGTRGGQKPQLFWRCVRYIFFQAALLLAIRQWKVAFSKLKKS